MIETAPEDDLRRVRRTWARAFAGGEVIGRLFYVRLFEIAPAVRPLFPEDTTEQARKLMQTLNWIVDHLDQAETLGPKASALALRHIHYGVEPAHYDAVGRALVDALRTGLGTALSDADAAAWRRVYGTLAETMVAAAHPDDRPGS